jgi:TRAP-type C4-dicarboxylate transport system substrate-binding protein
MTIRVRMAGYQSNSSVHTSALRALANSLDSNLFAAEITPDITAYGHRAADLLTLTEQGELEICYFASSYLSQRVAEIELLDLPFLIDSREAGHALLDGPLCAYIQAQLESNSGYRILGWWDNGFRHFSSSQTAIRSPSDCAQQRIRTMGAAPQHDRVFSSMGFVPEPLDVKELMPAIRASTIDAQENPLTNIWNFEIYKYHRWITLTGHFFGATFCLCNADFYSRLSSAERTALDNSAAAATAYQRELAVADEKNVAAKLNSVDVELIHLTSAELEKFKQVVQPTIDSVLARFPSKVTDLLPGHDHFPGQANNSAS